MIKAIIFDMGSTLVKAVNASWYIGRSLNVSEGEFRPIFRPLLYEYTSGRISRQYFWSHILKKLEKPSGREEIKKYEKILISLYKKYSERKLTTIEIARSLKRKGYKLAILSNVIPEHAILRRKQSFIKIFDYTFFSSEIKMIKPDRRVYLYVIKKMKVKPEECLFIDNHDSFILAARNVGMKTVLYKNPAQLKKDLKKMKVL